MKSLSTFELKFFLYIQVTCLVFAAIGLSIREYLVLEAKEVFNLTYVIILVFLLLGFLLQVFAKNKIRQILMSLGVFYAVISVILTVFMYIRL